MTLVCTRTVEIARDCFDEPRTLDCNRTIQTEILHRRTRDVGLLKRRSNFRWFHKSILIEAEESEKDIEAISITNDINEMSSGAAASGPRGDARRER